MGDNSDFDVSTSSIAHVVIVSATGDIDMRTAPMLQVYLDGVVDEILAHPGLALVLDLSRVKYLGSVGISVVTTVRNLDVPFAVVAAGGAGERPLRLTGVDTLVDMCPSLDAAVAKLGGAGED